MFAAVTVVDPKLVVARYQAGFKECATEVDRYLSSIGGLTPDARDSLMSHLASCIRHRQLPPAAPPLPQSAYVPPALVTSSFHHQQSVTAPPVGRPFGHYDVTTVSPAAQQSLPYVVGSTPFAAAAAAAAAMSRGHVATTTRFHGLPTPSLESIPGSWTPTTCDGEPASMTIVDEADRCSVGREECEEEGEEREGEIYRTNATDIDDITVDGDDDDDGDERERVSTTWNTQVACRDGRLTRPLAVKNNNVDNIARNIVVSCPNGPRDGHQFSSIDLMKSIDDQFMSVDDAVKEEPVWRPW